MMISRHFTAEDFSKVSWKCLLHCKSNILEVLRKTWCTPVYDVCQEKKERSEIETFLLQVAEIMNEHFINVKVDREERPDVDKVYMSFVQATTGGGGWPMSVFLTPKLKPIYGGTYFPPQDSVKPKSDILSFDNNGKEKSDIWQLSDFFYLIFNTDLEQMSKPAILKVIYENPIWNQGPDLEKTIRNPSKIDTTIRLY